ncbi:MAG: signal recognition particle-docking protein FtsY, partial [Actinobacteria bacterium]|nr:signal recognition particle-docking protein FtsY [Actinomycetota bacterium]
MDNVLFPILITIFLLAIVSVAFVATRTKRDDKVSSASPKSSTATLERTTEAPPGPGAVIAPPAEPGTGLVEPPVEVPGGQLGEAPVAPLEEAPGEVVEGEVEVLEPVVERATFRNRLARARSAFTGALDSIRGRGAIDQDTWDDLEEALLRADVGIAPTTELLDSVRSTVKSKGLTTADELIEAVKDEMKARLGGASIELNESAERPTIWLFVGVNGVGKTTTIGKVGKRLADEGRSVVMAAGDTFRAAAAEQLGTWAERCGAVLVRGAEGADPSSVIFDGVAKGEAIGAEFVLADTAGRLHTKSNLMDELGKVRRVADKGAGSVAEVLLVLDATTGQNGLI